MINCDWKKIIAHVDMDAFFAQVEERDQPGLKGKPVIIGGFPGDRSVVSTSNYIARKYGIRSGMSIYEAEKLCPHAIFLRTHGRKYTFVSLQVLEVLREVCDKVEMMSIDEAYLDMSHQRLLFPSLREMGLTIKQAVFDKVKVTCSVGVAPNKYVAKMCTGENKPNGLTIMDIEDYRETFAPRKVSELVGVGRHLEEALNRLGIRTVAQLQTFPEKILQTRFGICGPHLKKMANGDYEGIISANFREQPEDKSVGHSCTLSRDISDMESIRATLLELSCKVARRLRQGNFQGKRVTLTLRYQDFSTYTHQASLNYFTNDEAEIYREAVKCLDESYSPGRAVRLLGVRVSHLQKAPNTYSAYQTDLFLGSLAVKKHCVLKAADDIRDRFGEKALYYGGVAEVGKLFYSRNYSRNFLRPEVAKG